MLNTPEDRYLKDMLNDQAVVFDFDLEQIPPKPGLDMFRFLLAPDEAASAQQAVKAIYSFLFWEEHEGRNKPKIEAALASRIMLSRWIKDRADRGLSIFDGLVDMARRASLMFQISYERSGLQLLPDENEEIYESFIDVLREKIDGSSSPGEKSELAWAVEELIPQMKSRGLDIAPLIGNKQFYTKFRNWVQGVRQRDRLLTAVGRRYDFAKKQVVKQIAKEADPQLIEKLQVDLANVCNQERQQKEKLLIDYETVIREGLQDIFNPDVSTRQLLDRWKLGDQTDFSQLLGGTGYTALLNTQKVLFIAEFDYSLLQNLEDALKNIVNIKGMTDPALIITQLRQSADKLERELGGSK